jgi:uncharacterized membrane-anchored protein
MDPAQLYALLNEAQLVTTRDEAEIASLTAAIAALRQELADVEDAEARDDEACRVILAATPAEPTAWSSDAAVTELRLQCDTLSSLYKRARAEVHDAISGLDAQRDHTRQLLSMVRMCTPEATASSELLGHLHETIVTVLQGAVQRSREALSRFRDTQTSTSSESAAPTVAVLTTIRNGSRRVPQRTMFTPKPHG